MHEMSVAESIIEIVRQHLPPGDDAPVRSVRLKVGRMSGVVPASLEFCFEALTSGTRLGGASLVIDEVPVAARCAGCGTTSEVSIPFRECPACGSDRMTMVSGTELHVVDIELGDDERAGG
jgi:hydrogenase nickel incorporation protein HypA/HybF